MTTPDELLKQASTVLQGLLWKGYLKSDEEKALAERLREFTKDKP